ncbi:MAG TPA: type IV toxin-antitoxin system AbiEi family antitoxin [Nocardioidaceae bacterium]|nr:type IV toxin-antitoxin system AbiEi family antitoxin [Nocardioidaceae bacterium]
MPTLADRGTTAGLPSRLARRTIAVVRPADAADIYAQPRPEFQRLVRRGLLHRLANGYYAIVPRDRIGDDWRPTLEAAAVGIGAAAAGPERAVLMGLSAARMHGAIPRAVGVAVVAVPRQRGAVELADRDARVIFVRRDTDAIDAERLPTDLGPALVTGVEQTVLDLAHRPELGGLPDEVHPAIRALLPRCDGERLDELAGAQRLRAALRRARDGIA